MVRQLSGLVSEKVKKPIILNGKLVVDDGALVLARREKYSVIFSKSVGGKEVTIENAEDILNAYADAFNSKFSGVFSRVDTNATSFHANVDSFSGAVVLKNGIYTALLDKSDENHFHDGRMQFRSQVQDLITEFNRDFIFDYFDIYQLLLDRRLMASHIPAKIKGHLVAGLYQPLVVRTRHIDCPLELPEFQWFFNHINSPEICEERLESVQETARGLELTVIAMSDFSKKFGTKCMRELNRRYFQFILYAILCGQLNPGFSAAMCQRYKNLYRYLQTGNGDTEGVYSFLLECSDGIQRCRSQLVVR